MNKFTWKQDPDKKKAVLLVPVNKKDVWYWDDHGAAYKEAYAWCNNNGIFCWGDTLSTIKFTSEKDMFTFLIRWA